MVATLVLAFLADSVLLLAGQVLLNAISAKLDTTTLLELNARLADPSKPDAATVAKNWLSSAGI